LAEAQGGGNFLIYGVDLRLEVARGLELGGAWAARGAANTTASSQTTSRRRVGMMRGILPPAGGEGVNRSSLW
jgi:hypothetical protein